MIPTGSLVRPAKYSLFRGVLSCKCGREPAAWKAACRIGLDPMAKAIQNRFNLHNKCRHKRNLDVSRL